MSNKNDGYERFNKMTLNAGATCEISAQLKNAAGTVIVTDGSVCLGKPRTGAVVGGVYTDQFAEVNGVKIDFHNGEATSLNDYDARIEVSGPSVGNGQSALSIDCGVLALNASEGVLFGGSVGADGSFLMSQGIEQAPVWFPPGTAGSILYIDAEGMPSYIPLGPPGSIFHISNGGIPGWLGTPEADGEFLKSAGGIATWM